MKIKALIVFISLFSVFSLSAQKAVRKNIKQGNRSYKEQKYEQAADRYEEALKINPSALEPNYNLGNTFYKQNRWDESIEQQNHYLQLEKENPEKVSSSWHNIGNAFLHKKDLEKTMEAYKMALRINPNDDETRYNLAVVQKMINDQDEEQDQQDQKQDKDQKDEPQPPEPQDKPKKTEEQSEPEQMSRENARQILQAIEQDEKETQQRLNEMKAEERKKQAEENRRLNKDW